MGKETVVEDLKESQEKATSMAEEMKKKVERPCPHCGQELPPDYVKPDMKKVTLNVKDATALGQAQAKLERMNVKAKDLQNQRTEYLMDLGETYDLFDPTIGYDRSTKKLTYADANGARHPHDAELAKEECREVEHLTWKMTRAAVNAQKAGVEVETLANGLAEKYGWIWHPFDIRKGEFVEVSTEMLKQRETQMEQARAQAKQILEPQFSNEAPGS